MHAVVTEEGIRDTEASDRDSEARDPDPEASDQNPENPEASDQDPEASDASYLQPGPARQYDDGGKAALSTVVVDADVFVFVVVVAGTVQNDLCRISIRIKIP